MSSPDPSIDEAPPTMDAPDGSTSPGPPPPDGPPPSDENGAEEEQKKDRKRSRRSRSRSRDRERRSKRSRRSRSRSRDRGGRDRERSSRRRERSPSPPSQTAEELATIAAAAEREANRDEYTVFVTQIFPRVDERDLFEFFSHVGRVEDIRLIRDQRTQKSKGLAYIEFWEKDSVNKAVTLTGQLLGGYPITIELNQQPKHGTQNAESSLRLCVGDLHPEVADTDLRPVFEAFGELDFIDLHKNEDGTSKGVGFVQYAAESDGRAALEALDGLEIAGRHIKVTIADEQPQGNGAMSSAQAGQLDDSGTGGMALNAASRAALMQKLGRGTTDLSFPGAAAAMAMPRAPTQPAFTVPQQPSTCIVVKNMFDPRTETEPDFDLDIKEDVEEEATKFGPLKHILVDKHSAGHVYIRYQALEGAVKLQAAFHGRWFASRQISAEFVVDTIYVAKFPEAK